MNVRELDAAVFDDCMAALGEAATINGTAATGSFHREHVAVTSPDGVDYSGMVTTFTVRSDVAAAVGQALVYLGTSYKIVDIQPDGYGAKRLVLEA